MQQLQAIEELEGPIEEGVAVLAMRASDTQIHLGLLYHQAETSNLVAIHLAWHQELCQDDAKKWHVYVVPKIHPMRGLAIAAMCQNIWDLHSKGTITFGFDGPNDCFDAETYEYLLTDEGQGLTCATFVLAVFVRGGFNLLDISSWESRQDDSVWQDEIIELLKGRASESHLRRLRENVGAVRVRPTEVLAGAALFPPPAKFTSVATLGRRYKDHICETFSS